MYRTIVAISFPKLGKVEKFKSIKWTEQPTQKAVNEKVEELQKKDTRHGVKYEEVATVKNDVAPAPDPELIATTQ